MVTCMVTAMGEYGLAMPEATEYHTAKSRRDTVTTKLVKRVPQTLVLTHIISPTN
jgi:hypothetical protein